MKIKILVLSMATVVFNGCTSHLTPPVQLDNSPAMTINQGLLKVDRNNVPQDIYLSSHEWRARLTVHRGRYFLPNNKLVKTFYYAHHAYRIKLTGDRKIIKSYKYYFQRNGVKATICLNSIKRRDKYRVDMSFSHLNSDLEMQGCGNGKDIVPATSKVIDI